MPETFLQYYRSGKFDRAISQFKGGLELNSNDKLSGTYVKRCEYLKDHPLEGVWVMKSK